MVDLSSRPLRVALLSFAHVHAAAYARLLGARDDVELVVTDPGGTDQPGSGARGRALAAELGVDYVETYDEAFAWQPDAVVIASENSGHRELAVRAAQAGVHVLCEKPLATTTDDAEAMVAAADDAQVVLMTAYPVRFSAAFGDVRSRILEGDLGQLLAFRGVNNGTIPVGERGWFTDPVLAGGGALVDHVVHCADLIDAVLGVAPTTVRAVTNRILHRDRGVHVETGGLVTLEYPEGVIATIDCSWSLPAGAVPGVEISLQAVGTEGTLDVVPFAPHLDGHDQHGPIWAGVGDDLDEAMLDEFLAAVRGGRAAQPDGLVGLRTLRVVAAAQRSAETGQPVRLDPTTAVRG